MTNNNNKKSEEVLDGLIELLKEEKDSDEDEKANFKVQPKAKNGKSKQRLASRKYNPAKCMYCSKWYSSATNMKRHIRRSHNEECDINKSDSLETELEKPLEKPQKLRCSTCSINFTHPFLHDIHQCPVLSGKSIHKMCDCGKVFSTIESFEFHSFFHSCQVEILYNT